MNRMRLKKVLINIYMLLLKKYSLCKDFILKKKLGVPKVMSIDQTIEYILNNQCSVSRYGDGELKIVCGENIRFQDYEAVLSKRLSEIIRGDGTVLVCISNIFHNLNWMIPSSYEYTWRVVAEHRKEWTNVLNLNYEYGNAFISRLYLGWKDKSNTSRWFSKIKKIWEGKDIVFVEGEQSRLGYGNDLFSNAKSIKRVLCPIRNAYSKYDSILNEVKKLPQNVLILIALGPTATVLAYDLAKEGYWAIDIGHIDIQYEWYKKGVTERVPVRGKFTNEAQGGDIVEEVVDEEFNKQIIAKIL